MQHPRFAATRLTIDPQSIINVAMKTLPVTIIITCRIIIS